MRESDQAWFQPLWRRVAVTALCAVWAGFEWWNGDQFWGLLTLGLFAYCIWAFFISFKAEKPAPKDGTPPPED